MRRLLPILALLLCALSAPAHAATVSVEGGTLRVTASPGESNGFVIEEDRFALVPGSVEVRDDWGSPLQAGAGCVAEDEWDEPELLCEPANRVAVSAGDGDDSVELRVDLPSVIRGGPGDDRLLGGDGPDRLLGERGSDTAYGGDGRDRIEVRDRKVDSTWCGDGRDVVRAEVLDSLDFACERVNYGPPGRVGRLLARTGGGRMVPVPGQPGTTIDRRLLRDVLQLIRRYRIDLGDCLARHGHTRLGEHPLGLACDIVPGPGGSWNLVDKLARWAEPRQNRPRPPFRWVGYDGDAGHGRGDHLHLSWDHTPTRPFRIARTVWVWQVSSP